MLGEVENTWAKQTDIIINSINRVLINIELYRANKINNNEKDEIP